MKLDPLLLEILVCPTEQHAPLEYDEAASELLCTECDRAYAVDADGIPNMLIDDARRRGSAPPA